MAEDWNTRFIWSAFEAMARAACLMKNGSVINASPAKWERLVHRDIKPANSVLSGVAFLNANIY
ncbi:hypothetical protein D0868_11987 [Hortaea werneckii]|uniref:Protein kinase domain-containing protein n=1 Tax=Hortaea werneckii TaxID=91943 RepID=A0A3M6XW12_HORWE|nr:hypothetical protein D0868_11987 [Hortaea werneckii]